jgi:hypothetical protein
MGNWQLFTATPSWSTVQAPQLPTPQPYFVPVKRNESLKTQSKGVSGSAWMDLVFPLRIKRMDGMGGAPCKVL